MTEEHDVSLPRPHLNQKKLIDQTLRFNVVCNGRRWGKTKLAVWLAAQTMLAGGSVGYFVPTYEFGEEFWEEMKERFETVTETKHETKLTLRIIGGGSLKIWSLEKKRAGRGRKYNRVIIDEAAFAKDLKTSWTKAIRATLTDLKGDAFFLSTPDGYDNYFYSLFENDGKKGFDNWKSFQMPSNTNPYLSQDELDEIESQLDPLTFAQEFKAEFVDFTGRPFAYSFKAKQHVSFVSGAPSQSIPLYLSFDFNIDPCTCVSAQHAESRAWIRFHKEFRLAHSNIYDLCDALIAEYGVHDERFHFKITGDASGQSGSAMVEDNINYYIIIHQKLGVPWENIFLPSVNPRIKPNRVLVNSLFARHEAITIDAEGCPFLIEDLKYVETDDKGDINKKKDARRSHLLDCLRYYFNSFFADFVKIDL